MTFHRRVLVALIAALGLLAFAAPGSATHLAPFIDLQKQGLTLAGDGKGLTGWNGSGETLSVNVGGNVDFALLYWAGRERGCTLDGTGTNCPFAQPYKDQEMVFHGTPVTGTVIGSETQPATGEGEGPAILNIGYFADVTSLVKAVTGTPATPGVYNFTFSDGNNGSNLWRINGVTLLIGYTDASDPATHRVIIWDGLDSAFGIDPTPGETRVTAAANLDHGANLANRLAKLWIVLGDGTNDRPENITMSNNPTVFDSLDGSSGDQWDTDTHSISIPAGVGITTVQANSAPNNQNPDSLLWEVVALEVEQLDTSAPDCPTTVNSGPPTQAITTFQDTGSGLASLLVTKSENADTVVPPFTVGETGQVVVTSTKIDQSQRARIEIRATDLAGNTAICDPIHLLLSRDSKKPTWELNTDVPRAEDKVTVRNGKPGVSRVDIIVNGVKFQVKGLRNGAETTVDISSAMHDGNNNKVKLVARGNKGTWAEVIIWDGGGAK
jgi:hypothetical protein